MRTTIGLILVLVGAAIMLGGFAFAVTELSGMYASAMDDAMADGNESAVSQRMLRAALIGLAGFPVFLVGSVMTGRGLIGRLTRRRKN